MACVFWFWRPSLPQSIDRRRMRLKSTHNHRITMLKGACLEPGAAELEAHSGGRSNIRAHTHVKDEARGNRRGSPAAPRLLYSAQAPSAVMGGVDQPEPTGPRTAIPERPSMPGASQNSINPRPLPPAAPATSGAGKQGGIWSQLKIEVRGTDESSTTCTIVPVTPLIRLFKTTDRAAIPRGPCPRLAPRGERDELLHPRPDLRLALRGRHGNHQHRTRVLRPAPGAAAPQGGAPADSMAEPGAGGAAGGAGARAAGRGARHVVRPFLSLLGWSTDLHDASHGITQFHHIPATTNNSIQLRVGTSWWAGAFSLLVGTLGLAPSSCLRLYHRALAIGTCVPCLHHYSPDETLKT